MASSTIVAPPLPSSEQEQAVSSTETETSTGGSILKPSRFSSIPPPPPSPPLLQKNPKDAMEKSKRTLFSETKQHPSKRNSLGSFRLFAAKFRSSINDNENDSTEEYEDSDGEERSYQISFSPKARFRRIMCQWTDSQKKNMFYSQESMNEIQFYAYCEKEGLDADALWLKYLNKTGQSVDEENPKRPSIQELREYQQHYKKKQQEKSSWLRGGKRSKDKKKQSKKPTMAVKRKSSTSTSSAMSDSQS